MNIFGAPVRRAILGLAMTSLLALEACMSLDGMPLTDRPAINVVVLSDGTKLYTASGTIPDKEEVIKKAMIAEIAKRCSSPVEVTHWQAWDRTNQFNVQTWTEFEINARCT